MRILLVEDGKKLAEALKHILTKKKHIVDIAYDGRDGLTYALNATYDIIILDIMLPELNGFEVAKELRKAKCSTPILMLTAKDTVPDKVTGLNAGGDDYMTKPFATEELLARINALTRRQGSVIMDKLTYADLSLDLESANLECNGQDVNLRYKEFEILKLFLRNSEITLTKEIIINKVWGTDSDADDNNVEAYISFLRKKLRYLKSKVSIINLQKIGYRLEVSQ